MKKRIFALLLVLVMVAGCVTGCGSKKEETKAETAQAAIETQAPETAAPETTEAETETAAPEETETVAPVETTATDETTAMEIADFAGLYVDGDNDTLHIFKDGSVDISIVRLTDIQAKATSVKNGKLKIKGKDASGKTIKFSFNPKTGKLKVTKSKWEYLQKGDSFTFEADENLANMFAEFVGTYTGEDDDSLEIKEDGTVVFGITRLAEMEGRFTAIEDGVLVINLTDPSDKEMIVTYTRATGVVEVVYSTWEYLAVGDSFTVK